MSRRSVVLLAVALSAAACASKKEAPAAEVRLECSVSAPARVQAGEPVPVQVRLTNRSARPVSVLTWRTPLEGLLGNDFLITRDGTELPYEGPMVKRGDPAEEDYAFLGPGASAEASVDVSLAYPVKTPGHYRLTFRGPLMDVVAVAKEVPHSRAQMRSVPVACPTVETDVVAPGDGAQGGDGGSPQGR